MRRLLHIGLQSRDGNGAVFRYLAAACIVAVIASASYQAVASDRERRELHAPGRMIRVADTRLHINCTGAGSPTVVLESGSGTSSNIWALVQPRVAAVTRVCSYDRAGFGWSGDRPEAYDPAAALRSLMVAAGEKPPFVLAGHSLGGEYVRICAHEYPGEVAGLVLIATAHPDTGRRDPALAGTTVGPGLMERAGPLLAMVGLFRIWPESLLPEIYREYVGTLRQLPPNAANAELAFIKQTRYYRTVLAELRDLADTGKRVDVARDFADRPLVVISERWTPDPRNATEVASAQVYEELQTAMAGFSRAGSRMVLDGGHVLPVRRAEEVAKAIVAVVFRCRR